MVFPSRLIPSNYCLIVRVYDPGREDHEFNLRLGNFFLVV